MDFHTWLIYLLAAIGLSLSPGPNGLLALTHGALHGRRRALYTVFGGACGFVAVIALSMFGIGALLQASLAWLTVMKWVGGLYLVWLGIQVWRAPPIGADLRTRRSPRRLVAVSPGHAVGVDQLWHCSFRRLLAAVHRSSAQPDAAVRRHGGHVCRHRDRDRSVHRQHGSTASARGCVAWANASNQACGGVFRRDRRPAAAAG
jgi:hypothetical protein